MKKLFSIFMLQALIMTVLHSQAVSDYSYKFDNGIIVKTERCWNQTWVQQSYAPLAAGDKMPLAVSIRALGDLISGSTFKLLNAGKEVKMQNAPPGTYDLRMTFKLSGNPGSLSFVAGNIIIKPNTKTTVSVTLYDYLVFITETKGSLGGLSYFESKINRSKSSLEQNLNRGIPSVYETGKHDKPISAEVVSETSGKIKPGTYDLLVTLGISGQIQKVWLEKFVMKPDVSYKISINLNAGEIIYAGGNKDVKIMHFYPAGTAAIQSGTPAPVKGREIMTYESVSVTNACPPGHYDVLLNYKNGAKYEWKKNIVVMSGSRTDVK
jgi:hypothetical protein